MDTKVSLDHLLKTPSAAELIGADLAGSFPASQSFQSVENESIFANVVERLLQGGGVKLGDEESGQTSLEILLENSPDPVLMLSDDGGIIEANPAFCGIFSYARNDIVGTSIFRLFPEHYRAPFVEKLRELKEGGSAPHAANDDIVAFRGFKADGSIVTMDCFLALVLYKNTHRIIAVIRDLTTDKELYEQLKESRDHYVALSETIVEAIFRLDSDFHVLFVNSGVKNTFGFEPSEVLGKSLMTLFPEEVFRDHEQEFRKYFMVDDQDRRAFGLKRTIELLGLTKNRGVALMEMSFGNSKEFRGRTLTCIVRDVTQRKMMERRLRHLAYHDKLTGVGNRDLFTEDMKAIESEPNWDLGRKAAVLFLDLDGFKQVNDTLGHAAGDSLLVEVARRIRVCLRDSDSPYRFGGDEFVALLRELKDGKDARLVADRILESIRSPFWIRPEEGDKIRVAVGVSVGVSLLPDHGQNAESATRCADIAMYYSKEAGKNRVTIYDDSMKTKSMQEWNVDREVQTGLVNGNFQLHYQPIVTPQGRLLGLEALLRWNRGGNEYIPPASFIPIAEENGVIIPLGMWVFRRAFADLNRLEKDGFRRLRMAVNVSTRQFEHAQFISGLTEAVNGAGIDSSRIILEITETTLMREPDEAIAKIINIKKRFPEIMFAIDDFGTGYSSLSYLSRLPIDILKVDQSFVRALEREQNRKVVNSVLNLAKSLRIRVIAEGIENNAQREFFTKRECYGLQGYLFMKPVPIAELVGRMRKRSRAESPPKAAISEIGVP